MGNPDTAPDAGRSATATATAIQSTTYAACFERLLPEAERLRETEVQVCRADVRIAFANAKRGVEAVCADPPAIRAALPLLPLDEVLSLPDLGRALVFAALRVTGRPASAREIDAKLRIVRTSRAPMLSVAETFAARGLLPSDKVAAIRRGTGKYDMAGDGVALVRLYREHAAVLRGRHPFTEAEFTELLDASEWLLERLRPAGARPPAPARKRTPEDIRDRLWTLMVRRHVHLRAIGHYFHGDDFERFTPKLQSRLASTAFIDAELPARGGAAGAMGAAVAQPRAR